ncbi:RidA family protein [Candidatus Sumerlaeota bacterium]|nr:RidA family protein [Candidatus Sumerlaeota bacterium]
MPEKIDVVCSSAPQAIGPYSQAIKYDQMLFLSGQIPVDPRTGEISAPDIAGQTRQVLDNMKAILEATGASMNSIVKTTVYLTSLLDFEMMNEVYAPYFDFRPPARSTVEVAALPKGALVEIDAIAFMPVVPDTSGGLKF